ncbi:MAG: hypothetical protein WDM89_01090 [Rhizomicrobium sp.]
MQQSHALIYLPVPTKDFAKYQKNYEENDERDNQSPQDVTSHIIHRIPLCSYLPMETTAHKITTPTTAAKTKL